MPVSASRDPATLPIHDSLMRGRARLDLRGEACDALVCTASVYRQGRWEICATPTLPSVVTLDTDVGERAMMLNALMDRLESSLLPSRVGARPSPARVQPGRSAADAVSPVASTAIPALTERV